MPKNISLVDEKPKGNIRNEFPKNINVVDTKPKGYVNDPNVERYEAYTNILSAGMWIGNPFITYAITGTATGTQPIGGFF